MTKKLPVVNLVDVNNLLHIGNHRFGNYSVSDVAGNNIKTGGMYMVLNLLRRKIYHHTGNIWVFCFDRKSFRREVGMSLGIDYKTGRSKMPSHLMIQSEELFNWLPKIGYNTIGIDGLEADDIINSIVHLLKDQPVKINILSTDRDLSFNVSDKCNLVSSNLKVPTVTKENYESTVGNKGHHVYYNSILLYKVICGDSSDGIPPIAKESYAIYKTACNRLKEMNFDLSTLSNFETMEEVLEIFNGELKEKALSNWQLIKPFIMEENINLKPQSINEDALYEFCSIFGMKSIAKKFEIDMTNFHENVTKYRLDLYARTVGMGNNDDYEEEEDSNSSSDKTYINGIDRLKIIDDIVKDITVNKKEPTVKEMESMVDNIKQSITEDINQ